MAAPNLSKMITCLNAAFVLDQAITKKKVPGVGQLFWIKGKQIRDILSQEFACTFSDETLRVIMTDMGAVYSSVHSHDWRIFQSAHLLYHAIE